MDAAQTEKLKALALAAEQMFGKWFSKFQAVDGISDDDAVEFIAACSPATVLEMIADHDKTKLERDELRTEVERLRAELAAGAARKGGNTSQSAHGCHWPECPHGDECIHANSGSAPAAGTEKDAERYRALFEIDDFMRDPLWPVVEWMRGHDVSKADIDEALDAAIAHTKAKEGA